MTADAKVGLLLGLFFIVVIAFLINGLPNFIQKETTTEAGLKTALATPTGPDLVINRRISETAQQLTPGIPLRVVEPPKEVMVLNPMLPQAQPETPAFAAAAETPVMPQPQIVQVAENPVSLPAVESVSLPVPKAAVLAANSKTHVVQKGETLAVIAKKYYGTEEGNRRAMIQKLYEANKDVLSSPDKVAVGNKLVIPSAPGDKAKTPPASQSLLKKFTTMFEHAPSQPKAQRPAPTPPTASPVAAPALVKVKSVKTKEYVVQPGDNLWKVAQKTTGDGRQFNKIMQLNQDRLKNADDLVVGMKIAVPAR